MPAKRIDPLNRLRALKYEAGHGDKEAFERQHEKGKLTARERIQRLVDRNSFEELDVFANRFLAAERAAQLSADGD